MAPKLVTLSFAGHTVAAKVEPTVAAVLLAARNKLRVSGKAVFDAGGAPLGDADIAAAAPGALLVVGLSEAREAPAAAEPAPAARAETSAGMILVRDGRAMLIRRAKPRFELPKGHVEAGETPEMAAVREAREEAGLESPVVPRRLVSTERYSFRHGRRGLIDKTVLYFLFEPDGPVVLGERERLTKEVRWVAADELRDARGRAVLAAEGVTAAVERALGGGDAPPTNPEAPEAPAAEVVAGVVFVVPERGALAVRRSRGAFELPIADAAADADDAALRAAALGALRERAGVASEVRLGDVLLDEVFEYTHRDRGLVRRRSVFFRASGADAAVRFGERPRGTKEVRWLRAADVEAGGLHFTMRTMPAAVRRGLAGGEADAQADEPRVELVSFGHKHGAPADTARNWKLVKLPNPARTARGRKFTGLDRRLADDLFQQPGAEEFYARVRAEVLALLADPATPRRVKLGFGCHGGVHRSVAVVQRLAGELPPGTAVVVTHRDIERRGGSNDNSRRRGGGGRAGREEAGAGPAGAEAWPPLPPASA